MEKVNDIGSFLNKLPSLNEKIRGNIFYRGQSKTTYKLTPSILRTDDLKEIENRIYSFIMTECSHEFEGIKSHNEILSKMQHYGVPTRLLDVTTNALVALYFACEDKKRTDDGIVFVIKSNESEIKQFDSDVISILSSLPRFNYVEKEEMKRLAIKYKTRLEQKEEIFTDYEITTENEIIKEFNDQKIIKRLLHEIKKEKPAFENIINPCDLLNNYFFIPRKNNARIIRQSGAFMMFGLGNEEIQVDDYVNRVHDYVNRERSYKITIDGRSKENIINQLKSFGISKGTLHPELYKVAELIKENPQFLNY